jgi:alpha-beta hydrolase superfamily lysophospholipase
VLAFLHGFGEHGGRYELWGGRFAQKGFAFAAMDLRGHGRSEGKRGHAASFRKLVKDTAVFHNNIRHLFPNIPVILYGHSLGGTIVVHYLISGVVRCEGAIIASPWFSLLKPPSLFSQIPAFVLKYLLPRVRMKFALDPEGLSRDPGIAVQLIKDPLILNRISVGLYGEILQAGLKASRSIYKINIPMLVMHGDADRITSVKKSREFVMNANKRSTYKEWPGSYHELHNEPDADLVFEYMLKWIENL